MAKGGYVDGFVLVVSKKKLPQYQKIAAKAGKIWKKYGALDYKECVGDDLNHTDANGMTAWSFPLMTKIKPNETVVFSYILYKSRKHRDQVNAKVMKDPYMNDPNQKDMPFDMTRMAYGGFKVIVNA